MPVRVGSSVRHRKLAEKGNRGMPSASILSPKRSNIKSRHPDCRARLLIHTKSMRDRPILKASSPPLHFGQTFALDQRPSSLPPYSSLVKLGPNDADSQLMSLDIASAKHDRAERWYFREELHTWVATGIILNV